ncbi:MAG: hypothetical protein ALECFALPRED_007246 [Alectoria fallacina]|uniref:BED-type domain-containing protein n=1 Tax=Alectoria fallacina TaxID=1903189 RepID=A0A8H3GCI6_9LECA|nr:MAG: hypothetical protein ALECFALPRED_007246 [Alectoria fallacina]
MTPSDSDRSEAPTTLKTPFSIAARSTNFFKPTRLTWNVATRRPLVPPKSSQNRPDPQAPILRTSDDHTPLVTTPISTTATSDIAGVINVEGESSEDSTPDASLLQTTGSRSNVSQVPGSSFKRSRTKTSHIHEYISTRGDSFVCNRCSRVYKSSGGTGAISRHLKKAHFIDPAAGRISERRIRERTAVDATILRGAEINIQAEEKRRQELMGIGLNRTTLEYLYLQWTKDIPSKPHRDPAFRTFLEYVNPVANRMLLDSD